MTNNIYTFEFRLKNRKQNPECPCDREKIDTEKVFFYAMLHFMDQWP